MLRGITRVMGRHGIALLALFVALGGTSFAAASFINGKQIKPNSIPKNRLTKSAVKSLHGAKGAKGVPGQRGPTGAQGAPGTPGAAGPGARWAAVNPNATIARQSGGITVTNPLAGIYLANFGADVSRQLILVSDYEGASDTAYRGASYAGSCLEGPAVTSFCTSKGVTTPANVVIIITTATGSASEANHAFYISAIGPSSPTFGSTGATQTKLGTLLQKSSN